jgi:hypothetical protein
MDYLKLKIEISSAEYAGKSDDQVAAILNDPRLQAVRSRFITARSMLAELPSAAVILDKLEAAAAIISAVKWAMVYLKGDTGIDVGHPGTIAQLDALAAAGVLSSDEAAAVKNMALQPASPAELLGLGTVSYNDVNIARSLM